MLNYQSFTVQSVKAAHLMGCLLLVSSFQVQAETNCYRADTNSKPGYASTNVDYPSLQRDDRQHESIVTVTNATKGAHVLLGGTVKP